MEPSVLVVDPRLAAVRRRRVSLRSAMNNFEDALAMHMADRIERWTEGVRPAAEEVQMHLREHIVTTEGAEGFHAEILAAAPRLSHAVEVLVHDHVILTGLIAKIIVQLRDAQNRQDVEGIRERGTDLIARLSRHRQRGADLIYEAYEYDLGGED
jgi:hypothetical protein